MADTNLEDTFFLIAVDRSGEVTILDHSPEWEEFDIEHWWEDVFETDAPKHLSPGAYIWRGFTIGYWGEDDHLNLIGGEFQPFLAAHATPPAEG